MDIFKNAFDPEKAKVAFEKFAEEQTKMLKTASEVAKLESEEIVQLVSDLKDKKTLDEIANRYISYWSGVAVRSMGYSEKAKAKVSESMKAFA